MASNEYEAGKVLSVVLCRCRMKENVEKKLVPSSESESSAVQMFLRNSEQAPGMTTLKISFLLSQSQMKVRLSVEPKLHQIVLK